ncbi:MAG: hypothetical protein JJU20_10315 [Opitutales bacterium]|nr:hypothetical protein [Opitutales bacterium]
MQFDRIYLVDNGSLRPASYLNLKHWASELSRVSGREVLPVSLLHSSRIDPQALGGEQALVWERQLKADWNAGARSFCVLPFFIGPTAAVLDYMPERLAALREKLGDIQIAHGPFLGVDPESPADDLIQVVTENIREGIAEHQLTHPRVVLVDHGSPQPAVARMRDRIAEILQTKLQKEATGLRPASMERREGKRYAFNEPLLETVLSEEGWNSGEILVALLFLSPGRHAGPGGDIAEICENAKNSQTGLKTYMSPLIGDNPNLLGLLQKRLVAAEENPSWF